MADLLKGEPADYNQKALMALVAAIIDGKERWIRIDGHDDVFGRVWEIYRSIQTPSIRVRVSDQGGRVFHFNTNRIVSVISEESAI